MKEGSATFLDLIFKTYQELVKREELIIKCPSTLRLFCRLDVSVMKDAEPYSYFVSGLERTFGTELHLSHTLTSPTFVVSMADAFGAYILGNLKAKGK